MYGKNSADRSSCIAAVSAVDNLLITLVCEKIMWFLVFEDTISFLGLVHGLNRL